MPTVAGELYVPGYRPAPRADERRPAAVPLDPGRKAVRRVLEKLPEPEDAASAADVAYIDARRLRRQLIAFNP